MSLNWYVNNLSVEHVYTGVLFDNNGMCFTVTLTALLHVNENGSSALSCLRFLLQALFNVFFCE
jgi:hypothetical protein